MKDAAINLHNYGNLSFEELVQETINHSFDGTTPPADWLEMLRRAVIREVQVGEISIEQHEGYMSPDPMFTVGSKSKLVAGEYWLVPKAATTDSLENSRHSGKRERRASERKRP